MNDVHPFSKKDLSDSDILLTNIALAEGLEHAIVIKYRIEERNGKPCEDDLIELIVRRPGDELRMQNEVPFNKDCWKHTVEAVKHLAEQAQDEKVWQTKTWTMKTWKTKRNRKSSR